MPRLTLRWKLLLFAVAIAVVPILVAARAMIQIGEDELKSSANEQLLGVATEVAREINDNFERSWLGPLLLIRNAVDDENLGVPEKIALLTHGISSLDDIAALQITLHDADLPLLVTKDAISERLRNAGLDPLDVLRTPPEEVRALLASGEPAGQVIVYVPKTDDWLATIVLPLRTPLAGGEAVLSARVDLQRLREVVYGNPFTKTGTLTIVDGRGREVLQPERRDLSSYGIVAAATSQLGSASRSLGVEPYARPSGKVMLGAYAFPRPFRWAVLVELPERDAYLAIEKMTRSLLWWGAMGLAVAVLGAMALAFAISRPILEIDRAAAEVGRGNFAVRVVRGVRLNDEIGDLARRMNQMIVGLAERFQLERFVSDGTLAAIRRSGLRSVELGGTRQRATMLFADIRGYTAFAEEHEPALVVEVLNFYFQNLAELVKEHGGDIDKFVGDQILAVFVGDGAEARAVRCALAMQAKVEALGAERPSWKLGIGVGVNSGDVVMGAMGSRDRMDYTVLGDAVNIAARLCALAVRGQTLATRVVLDGCGAEPGCAARALTPFQIKGKREPVSVFEIQERATSSEPASA